ncbi:MAG: glycogen/starch synthase [bacterium]
MKILHVAAEVAPYVTIGGLSQVMYFLPKAQKKLGLDVRVFTPKYGDTKIAKTEKIELITHWLRVPLEDDKKPPLATVKIENDDTARALICNVMSSKNNYDSMTYFLENKEYFELRANVFGYTDDHIRFALLCKGALEWLLYTRSVDPDSWLPDVIHCHDWHTGYLVDWAKRSPRYKSLLKNTHIIFTIHNFAYQGNYDFRYTLDASKDDGKKFLASLKSPALQRQNALLRGVIYADGVNTVSPTHAREVLTPEYAEGLEVPLNTHQKKLIGIINGLDFEEFDPVTDKHIYKNFSPDQFVQAKSANKRHVQEMFGLPADETKFLIGSVGRIAPQKGWDLILEMLPNLLRERKDIQIIVIGRGDEHYCQQLIKYKRQFTKQIGIKLVADFQTPRHIFAGADVMLIASSFEPGGIVALEAMRYGAVPIIRRTGGLNDVVSNFNPGTGRGNGFSFQSMTPWALYGAIIEAQVYYATKVHWYKIVENCLRYDSSWEHSAKKYLEWYKSVTYTT